MTVLGGQWPRGSLLVLGAAGGPAQDQRIDADDHGSGAFDGRGSLSRGVLQVDVLLGVVERDRERPAPVTRVVATLRTPVLKATIQLRLEPVAC